MSEKTVPSDSVFTSWNIRATLGDPVDMLRFFWFNPSSPKEDVHSKATTKRNAPTREARMRKAWPANDQHRADLAKAGSPHQ